LAATVATVAAGGRGGAKAVPQPNAEIKTEIQTEIQAKAIAVGLYAANMPEELGGGGLDDSGLGGGIGRHS
jgi:alkylation response protein AidB-like acyl-CoA dehydrogenase